MVLDRELQSLGCGHHAISCSYLIEQQAQREVLDGGLHRLGIEPRYIEQRVEQSLQNVQATAQVQQLLRSFPVGDVLLQPVGEQEQRLQRLAQVVAGRGEELGLRQHGFLSAFFGVTKLQSVVLECLDGLGHTADLILPVPVGYDDIDLPRRQFGHDVGHSRDRRRDAPQDVHRAPNHQDKDKHPAAYQKHSLVLDYLHCRAEIEAYLERAEVLQVPLPVRMADLDDLGQQGVLGHCTRFRLHRKEEFSSRAVDGRPGEIVHRPERIAELRRLLQD